MITMEERELLVRFGDKYREYQSRVPALSLSLSGKRNPPPGNGVHA